jgi:hypothetical protein
LVVDADGVDVCDTDPGHPVTATVTTPLRLFVDVWRGEVSWSASTEIGLAIDAPQWARRALPRWLRLSAFASVPRPARPTMAAHA